METTDSGAVKTAHLRRTQTGTPWKAQQWIQQARAFQSVSHLLHWDDRFKQVS